MHASEKYANLKGDNNPMRNPEVAAKQSASLKATLASPAKRAAMKRNAKARWTPEQRAAQSERAREAWAAGRDGVQWSEERKQQHSQRMQAYWAKVKAALAAVGESQHGNKHTN